MTWCSVDRATPRFDLASSAIRCRFVHRFVRSKVLSRVSRQRFSPVAPPIPRLGPGESGSPRRQYYEGATTSHPRIPGHLFVSLPGSTRSLLLRARRCQRSRADGGSDRARTIVQPAVLLPACSRVDVSGTSQVLRRSILCLCPGPRPRPNRRSLANDGLVDAAPAPRQRLQHCSYRGYCGASAPAVYASRTVLPPPHARLASGWLAGLCREGVEPSGSLRKVSDLHLVPLSWIYPDATSGAFCYTLCQTASIVSATMASSATAPAPTASLSVSGCSMAVTLVPASLPTIAAKAIARSDRKLGWEL